MALTVSELIAVLQTFDGWLPVVAEVDGFLARDVNAVGLRVGSLARASECLTPRGTYRRRVVGREPEEPALIIGLWPNPLAAEGKSTEAA